MDLWGMKSPLVACGMHLQGTKSPERAEEWVVAWGGDTDLWGMKSPKRAEERLVGRYGTVGYEESPEDRGAGGGEGGIRTCRVWPVLRRQRSSWRWGDGEYGPAGYKCSEGK
jgi:hypothetical protein